MDATSTRRYAGDRANKAINTNVKPLLLPLKLLLFPNFFPNTFPNLFLMAEYEDIETATSRPRTVKEFDPDDQPRERAEKHGCGVLSVPDLLAIILRTGVPGMPITEMCRQIMRDNGGRLHRLERRTRQELRTVKGIGLTKSIQIEAIMELMRRYVEEEPDQELPITSSAQIFSRMQRKIGNLSHEEIWLLLLSRANKVIKEVCLTRGTATASLFDVRQAIKHAIIENAEGVVLVHNHPSGTLRPSDADDRITREFKEACGFMKLRLLDHVIVTADGYYSYHDSDRYL